MAYYIRKIAKSKWTSDFDDKGFILGYRADAIANDLKTSNDTLSLWRVDSLDSEEYRSIVAANSTLTNGKIARLYLLCIPEDMLINYTVRRTNGASKIVKCNQLMHYDLCDLTVGSLLSFASDVVIKLLDDSLLLRTCIVDEIMSIIDEQIMSNNLDLSDLNEEQQKQYSNWKEKQKS